ncbi:MoaB/Mog domain-containing protein [Russula earlei]|uniref:MoaB/Mog domain-containing protein n=1 Tax=Russula earlei TaxID=71964 RepID=A0ACC0TXR5_9AGAM|nr:MoaB/Mog domain-containing protein [Russula earlei]
MVDITHKVSSLRKAIATAIVKTSKQETIDAIQNRQVPKGDVFEFARAAGLLAIKKTSDRGLNLLISVEVHTIYKTGVEVEAMHGASITALTIYDMLKPIDKGIEISTIKLASKKGGKGDYSDHTTAGLRCAVVVCSDSVAAGSKQDMAGKAVMQKLQQQGLSTAVYTIIPDEKEIIQNKAKQLSEEGYSLVLFTGGTGLSPRDITPEAISPLFDREIPGIMEAARSYGQQRTPYAMLSRGVAGFIQHTLVLTLPGSTRGAIETMDALFPYIIHIFKIAAGMRHDNNGPMVLWYYSGAHSVVLCGGQSSRMGTDKALLPHVSGTWAQLAAGKLSALSMPVVLSVNQSQHAIFQKIYSTYRLVKDDPALSVGGPLHGILSTHLHYPADDLFILACDMINMQQETLQELYNQYQHNDKEAYIFHKQEELEPLCAIYTAKGLQKIYTLYTRRQLQRYSLKYVLEQLDTRSTAIPPAWEPGFANFNSPADL